MKVRDICGALEDLAPSGLAYEGDPVGLSVGHPDWEVSRVLVTLSVTPDAAKAALRKKAELIVSHHPVIWRPLRTLRTDAPDAASAHTRLCLELVQARVACVAAHTNLDVVPGGVNDVLADLLGLLRRKPLFAVPQAGFVKLVTFVPAKHLAAVRDAVCKAGAGVIGNYTHCSFSASGVGTFLPNEEADPFSGEKHRVNEEPEQRFETLVPKARVSGVVKALLAAHPYEEVAYDLVPLENPDSTVSLGIRGELAEAVALQALADRVCETLKLAHVRTVGRPDRRVRKVAVLGGSGGSRVGDVAPDLDVLVTGDVGYHDALTAKEAGLALIDAGHAGTERCAVEILAQFLRKRFKSLRVFTYDEPEVFQVTTR